MAEKDKEIEFQRQGMKCLRPHKKLCEPGSVSKFKLFLLAYLVSELMFKVRVLK